MKNISYALILLAFCSFDQKVFSQYSTSYLSYEYTEILSYSIKITYSTSGSYKPTTIYDFYGNALSTLQARYDQNRKVIEEEYGRVWYLELINKSNKATLNKYKSTIKAEIDAKAGYADFSKSSVTDSWVNFISQPFRISSIKDEIKLLQSCQKELNRIKYQDPDNYIYSKRYKSIAQTLEKLKTCSSSEIKNLSWQKTELNNNNNSNNTSGTTFKKNNQNTYTKYAKYDQSTNSWINIKDEKNIFVIKDDQLYRNNSQVSSNMLGLDVTYGDTYVEYIFFKNGGMTPYHYRFYNDSKSGLHVYYNGQLLYAYYNTSTSSNSGGYTNPTKEQLENTGGVRFYVNQDIGVIKIYVQNTLVGTLDKYYTNKDFVPDCDDNLGGAMDGVNLKVGTYSYYATTNGMTWEGQFTIKPGGCHTIRLTK